MDASSPLFHDFSALTELKRQARTEQSSAVKPVAEQFEAVFLQMLMKGMRATVPEGGLFDTPAIKQYQSMFDNQLAVSMAAQGGTGLAELIARQLEGNTMAVAETGDANKAGAENGVSKDGDSWQRAALGLGDQQGGGL